MFKDAKEHIEWFMQWLAYPIQNPGAKNFTAPIFIGEQGVGKSLLGIIVGDIYGDNFKLVKHNEIFGKFNEWAIRAQLVLGDEISGTDKRSESDHIKGLITNPSITIDGKFQPTYPIPDTINYILTSNHNDALYLEDTDRRFFVIEVQGKLPLNFYLKTMDEWRKNKGASRLFYHLLNEVDCASFNPKAPAPLTEAKDKMKHFSRTELEIWCEELYSHPESKLQYGAGGKVPKRDLFTAEELKVHYKSDVKVPALSKALSKLRFKGPYVTSTPLGSKRLWVVKNKDRWTDYKLADHKERVANYIQDFNLLVETVGADKHKKVVKLNSRSKKAK